MASYLADTNILLRLADTPSPLEAQRSRRMRKRSSTSAMTSCDTTPHREKSRSFETERIASHKIALSFLVPPSPLLTFTCKGMSRWVEVGGNTTTKSAGPALKKP